MKTAAPAAARPSAVAAKPVAAARPAPASAVKKAPPAAAPKASRPAPPPRKKKNNNILFIGGGAALVAIIIIVALVAGGGKEPEKAKGKPKPKVEEPAPVVKIDPAGKEEPEKSLTASWTEKLKAADALKAEGDKEYAKAENQSNEFEDRVVAYEKAQKMTSDAKAVYEAFCMDYEGYKLFGYDDKYDKAAKQVKDIKFKIEALKHTHKDN